MAQRPPSNPTSKGHSGARGDGRVAASSGASSVDKARPVAPAAAAEPIGPAAAVEGVQPTVGPEAIKPVAAAAPTAAAERIRSIAERLRKGTLSPSQAVEELIEDAVGRNLPGAAADSALSQELRALLQSYAQEDPYLASRISRLGIHR